MIDRFYDDWYNRDDPYRDTGAYGYSQAPGERSKRSVPVSQDFSEADARLENFYAGML